MISIQILQSFIIKIVSVLAADVPGLIFLVHLLFFYIQIYKFYYYYFQCAGCALCRCDWVDFSCLFIVNFDNFFMILSSKLSVFWLRTLRMWLGWWLSLLRTALGCSCTASGRERYCWMNIITFLIIFSNYHHYLYLISLHYSISLHCKWQGKVSWVTKPN